MFKLKYSILFVLILSVVFLGLAPKTDAIVSRSTLSKYGIEISSTSPENAQLLVNLPDIYLLPTSPFYPIKLFWEKLRLLFTDSNEAKIRYLFGLSRKRLAEAFELIEEGNLEELEDTLERFTKHSDEVLNTFSTFKSNFSKGFQQKFIEERLEQRKILNSLTELRFQALDTSQASIEVPERIEEAGLQLLPFHNSENNQDLEEL